MKANTDKIYSTSLVYDCYSNGQKKVNDVLIEKIFNDLVNLSDEYFFDWREFMKNKLKEDV